MRLKEKKLLQKFAATLKKFSAQGAKKVEYGTLINMTIQTRSEAESIEQRSDFSLGGVRSGSGLCVKFNKSLNIKFHINLPYLFGHLIIEELQ